MPDNSFDVVSKIELPEVSNAVQQAMKEVQQRYDLKSSNSNIELKEKENKILLQSSETAVILLTGAPARFAVPPRGIQQLPVFSFKSGLQLLRREHHISGYDEKPILRPADLFQLGQELLLVGFRCIFKLEGVRAHHEISRSRAVLADDNRNLDRSRHEASRIKRWGLVQARKRGTQAGRRL